MSLIPFILDLADELHEFNRCLATGIDVDDFGFGIYPHEQYLQQPQQQPLLLRRPRSQFSSQLYWLAGGGCGNSGAVGSKQRPHPYNRSKVCCAKSPSNSITATSATATASAPASASAFASTADTADNARTEPTAPNGAGQDGVNSTGGAAVSGTTAKSAYSVVNKNGFQVSMNVKQFAPNELTVKTIDNCIVVEGQHEDKEDGHGVISRHFIRKYMLPKGYDPAEVLSTLSSDGILTVKAPPPPAAKTDQLLERIVDIQQTGPAAVTAAAAAAPTPTATATAPTTAHLQSAAVNLRDASKTLTTTPTATATTVIPTATSTAQVTAANKQQQQQQQQAEQSEQQLNNDHNGAVDNNNMRDTDDIQAAATTAATVTDATANIDGVDSVGVDISTGIGNNNVQSVEQDEEMPMLTESSIVIIAPNALDAIMVTSNNGAINAAAAAAVAVNNVADRNANAIANAENETVVEDEDAKVNSSNNKSTSLNANTASNAATNSAIATVNAETNGERTVVPMMAVNIPVCSGDVAVAMETETTVTDVAVADAVVADVDMSCNAAVLTDGNDVCVSVGVSGDVGALAETEAETEDDIAADRVGTEEDSDGVALATNTAVRAVENLMKAATPPPPPTAGDLVAAADAAILLAKAQNHSAAIAAVSVIGGENGNKTEGIIEELAN